MAAIEEICKTVALDKARIEVETSVLDNGVVVATARDNTARTVSCGICVRHGAGYEGPKINGISHAIEHWTLNGSKRFSAEDLARRLARIGGDLGNEPTGTTYDHVVYTLKSRTFALTQKVLMPRLADMVLHPLTSAAPAVLEALRSVRTEHASESHDNVRTHAENAARAALFPEHPAGFPIDGTSKSIGALTPSALQRTHAKCYTSGSRFIIAAAGRVRHDEFKKLAAELFGRLKDRPTNNYIPYPQVLPIGRVEIPLKRESNKGSYLLLAWNATPVLENPRDRCALELIISILGDCSASRLYLNLRERHYIGYTPDARLDDSRFHAAVFIDTEAFRNELKDAERICMEEVTRIRTELVPPREFSDFALRQRQLIREKADDTDKLLEELIDHSIANRPKTLFEAYRLLDPRRDLVTRKDLLRVAQAYLDPANYVVVRVEGTKPFEAD